MIWTNNLSPWIVHFYLGGHELGVRWYGAAYAFGFILSFLAFRKAVLTRELPGSAKLVDRVVMSVLLGVLVGGRMGFVIQNLDEWKADPLFPFKVNQGGMAFFGGLAGVMLGLWWVAKKENVRFLSLTDVATSPAMLALGLGRLANFANKELWGRPTGAKWGVIYPNVDLQPRHPSELYEATSHFLAFGILMFLRQRHPDWCRERPGRLSALYLVLYGVLRFFTDFLREEPLAALNLNSGQWASLVVAAVGVGLWILMPRKRVSEPELTN
jgi:phosphatidylglycerol:prolipoprotein diacylglycerol transferase